MQTSVKQDDPKKQIQFALRAFAADRRLHLINEHFRDDANGDIP
jgi:hypothetical protein